MKLRFLGKTYTSLDNQIETVPSEHTARFLGQNYTLRRPILTPTKAQFGVRKYRGVFYGG